MFEKELKWKTEGLSCRQDRLDENAKGVCYNIIEKKCLAFHIMFFLILYLFLMHITQFTAMVSPIWMLFPLS